MYVCTDDVTGSWLLKGNAIELDGQKHMRIKDVGMKLDIGDMKIYATNMINGSPELSKYLLRCGFVCQKNMIWCQAKRKPIIKLT